MAYSNTLIRAKERTLGTVIEKDPENDGEQPDYESQSYRDQVEDVRYMRDVYEGTKALRAGKEKYLIPHPMESPQKYRDRVKIALSFGALHRTVGGLVGMVFRRDPALEDVPPVIEADLDDVDLQGRALSVFLRTVAENAVLDGHTWLQVDSPKVDPERVRNALEGDEAGIRPYWINLTKAQVHNWRYEMRDGRPVLTLFCYRESATLPDGAFGERSVQRVRVLREGERDESGNPGPVRGEVWEFRKGDRNQTGADGRDRWVLEDTYTIDASRIPVVAIYGERLSPFVSRPPLLALADEQVEHYRVRSERQKALTYASIAVPYAFGKGMTDSEGNAAVTWGADGMMLSNDAEANAGIIESRGYGLDALKQELQEIQARMASLGLQLLARANQAQASADKVTATSDLLSKAEGDAWLVAFALGLQDAVNEALYLHGEFRGVDNAGMVSMNRDFRDQLLDPQVMRELREMHAADIIPIEDVWDALKRGEILDEAFDFDEARARLAAQREERLSGMGTALFGEAGGAQA